MTFARRIRFVHAQFAWMLGSLLLLVILGSLGFYVYFIICLLGLLIIFDLTAPLTITPHWRKRLWVVISLGLVVFGAIVIRRLLEILPIVVF